MQQATTSGDVDPDLCRRMASLGPNMHRLIPYMGLLFFVCEWPWTYANQAIRRHDSWLVRHAISKWYIATDLKCGSSDHIIQKENRVSWNIAALRELRSHYSLISLFYLSYFLSIKLRLCNHAKGHSQKTKTKTKQVWFSVNLLWLITESRTAIWKPCVSCKLHGCSKVYTYTYYPQLMFYIWHTRYVLKNMQDFSISCASKLDVYDWWLRRTPLYCKWWVLIQDVQVLLSNMFGHFRT